MQIEKKNLENIGRRICQLNGQDPEAAIPVGEDGQAAPAWMIEAMFVNKMMVANHAVQEELASLPKPAAPPDAPLVYSPYHSN